MEQVQTNPSAHRNNMKQKKIPSDNSITQVIAQKIHRLMLIRCHLNPHRLENWKELLEYYQSVGNGQHALFLLNVLHHSLLFGKSGNTTNEMLVQRLFLNASQPAETFPNTSHEKDRALISHLAKGMPNNWKLWRAISQSLLKERRYLDYEQTLKHMLVLFPNKKAIKWHLVDLYMNKKYQTLLEEQTRRGYLTLTKQREIERQRNELALSLVGSLQKSIEELLLTDRDDFRNLLQEYTAILLSRTAKDPQDMGQAISIMEHLISSNQRHNGRLLAHYHHVLSTIYFKQGNFMKAIEETETSISLNTTSEVYQNRYLTMLLNFEKNKQPLALIHQLPPFLQHGSSEEQWKKICHKYSLNPTRSPTLHLTSDVVPKR